MNFVAPKKIPAQDVEDNISEKSNYSFQNEKSNWPLDRNRNFKSSNDFVNYDGPQRQNSYNDRISSESFFKKK